MGGGSHQTVMLGDLKWLLLSDLWVEILFQITALAFPERISLLLSSTQPFPELLGSDLQRPQPPGCSFPSYPSLACGFNRKNFTPTTDSWPKPQALLPPQHGRIVKSHPWLASGHPTVISLPFKLQSTGKSGRGPGAKPSSHLFI